MIFRNKKKITDFTLSGYYTGIGVVTATFDTYAQSLQNAGFTKLTSDSSNLTGSEVRVATFQKENRLYTLTKNKYRDNPVITVTKFLDNTTYTAAQAFSGILAPFADAASIAIRTGDGEYTAHYTGKGSENLTTYMNNMKAQGFTVKGQVTVAGVYDSYNFVKGSQIIHIYRSQKTGDLWVSARFGTLSDNLVKTNQGTAIDGEKTEFYFMNLSDGTDRDGNPVHYDNGLSQVIKLKNNHFLIFDGGYDANGQKLYELLVSLTPAGQKPVIDGWFISHAHGDHYGALNYFADKLYNKVYLNGVYYTALAAETISIMNDYSVDGQGKVTFTSAIGAQNLIAKKVSANRFKTESGAYTKVYRPTMGEKYYFCGTTVDVLWTNNVYTRSQFSTDVNCTSTVFKFSSDDQTLLMTGDAEQNQLKMLYNLYKDNLTFDYTVAAHHGINGGGTNFNNNHSAKIVLIPMSNYDFIHTKWNGEYDTIVKNWQKEATVSYYYYGDGTEGYRKFTFGAAIK